MDRPTFHYCPTCRDCQRVAAFGWEQEIADNYAWVYRWYLVCGHAVDGAGAVVTWND